MKTFLCMMALLVNLLYPQALLAKPLPVEYFAKHPQFNSIKLSPDGKHFAATVPKEKTTNLVVINRATMKPVIVYGFGDFEHVSQFYWANNERLVYTKSYKKGAYEQKRTRGEIFAANIDGSKREQLFGYHAGKLKGKNQNKNKRPLRAVGNILHMLPDDPQHILVQSRQYDSDYDDPIKLYKVNIYTLKRSLMAKTPMGNMRVVLNARGEPVIASGKDRQGQKHHYWYHQRQWQPMAKDDPLTGYKAVSVSKDGQKLYITKDLNGATDALFEYDFKTTKITMLFNHPVVDIYSFIREPGSRTIVGVKTVMDDVEYHYFDDSEYAQLYRQVAAAFEGSDVNIHANSLSDTEVLVYVDSDKNAGEYYLFNRQKMTIDFLLAPKQWLDPNQMQPRQAISFKARDGEIIHGYLTLPGSGTDHPLIVNVHGGPFGPQDEWFFDSEAQMYANNGYAVLQVNYRGSGGYGKAFEEVAYQKRSTLIQHDIIDGTRWALGLDEINDERVCIIGGSFGGYSALMSPLIEPDLYKCAIAMAGAYDLVYQMDNADYMDIDSVSVEARKKYGETREVLVDQSPITYIDKLKTPIFIVHGGRDERVPPEHARILKRALEKRSKPFEWLYKPKEGHGFYNADNRIELYQKSLAFIGKHLN